MTYRINPKARWHDGEPITAEDVIWSFETLKEVNAQPVAYYATSSRRGDGDGEVTFTFDQTGNRELPNIVGQLTSCPSTGGRARTPTATSATSPRPTLEPPLGSGPYRIASASTGRGVTYERVQDYWGADQPIHVGQYNFDRIDYIYFRDHTVAVRGLQGRPVRLVDRELRPRAGPPATTFPAVKNGRVMQELFENTTRRGPHGRLRAEPAPPDVPEPRPAPRR